MVASDGFAEFLCDQLAPLGRITMRRMFGKTGVFCDGFMLMHNTLYFRVDDSNRAAFKEAEFFPPLKYEKKGSTIDLSFWRPFSTNPGEFVAWARSALAAARRVAAKREPTGRRRKSPPQLENRMHCSGPIRRTTGPRRLKAVQAIVERAGQVIIAT
jgi:DNA transformation protein and related proteins